MSATPINIDPGQIQAPPDFSSQAVVQLSSGQRVVGPRANLPGLLKDDPGAKEIPVGADQVAVRLSNGRIAIGPKANILNLAQDDPGVRIVAGSLNGLPSRALTPEQQQQLDEFNAEPTGAVGVATGIAKGAVETMKGTLNLAGKAAGKEGSGDEALSLGGRPIDTEARNTSQFVGKVGESILEFIAGDEAFKGLSLAEQFGAAQKIAKLTETSPKLAKALDIGMTALRQGTVSGAQTIAKGGTPTQAAESAAAVGITSGIVGGAFASASALKQSISARTPESIKQAADLAEAQGRELAEKIAEQPLGSQAEAVHDVAQNLADAREAMHTDYAQGLAQIGQKAQGIRVPLAGSALQKTAQTLLSDSSVPAEIQTAMKGVVPDAARLTPLLEELATSPGNYSWEQIEATRQTIGQTIRKLPADSPLRPDLIRLRGALDDTMAKAATDSGNTQVAEQMNNLRSGYATQVKAFDSRAIQTLAGKNPDSVASVLLNKQSVFSVNTLRSLIGPENMKPVQGALLEKLVDDASVSGQFNPRSMLAAFNRLGADAQKAIWGDALPDVKNFLSTASQLPASSPAFQRLASFLEHRGIYALATGLIGGGIGGEFTGHHLVSTGAILAGTLMLGSGTGIQTATRLLELGKAAIPPVAAATAPLVTGTAAPEEQTSTPPEPAPQPIAGGASIGEQLIAKTAQAQQQKAAKLAAQQSRPALPFHPGAGISR